MITKYEIIHESIRKTTEIQCDICKTNYYQISELDNFYHFYKDYNSDSVFDDSDPSEGFRDVTDIEFDICQHCVKALLEGKLSNDESLKNENKKLKEEVEQLNKNMKKINNTVDSVLRNMNLLKKLEKI